MSKEKYLLFGILSVVLVLAFYVAYSFLNDKNPSTGGNQNQFQTLTSNQNNVEFSVTPISASEFQIAMNTHSVSLDFDLTQISTLYDNFGNAYQSVNWEGSEPGSHHRSGILKFPKINQNAKSIKLVIVDSATREFKWDIK